MKTLFTIFLLFYSFLLPGQEATDDWFVFSPSNSSAGSSIDMSSWLHKPAGKHGFLQLKGKDFVFEDGTPIKFWGVNIGSNRPFPDAQKAEDWTNFMAQYGINGVRFHKFTWEATDAINSTQLTDEKWEKFDFFCKTLRDAGIYYSWSHIYGHRVLPGDSARMLAYEEVKNTEFPWAHLNGSTASIVNFAEDLQAINIELTVNMLSHTNPHTGKKYADDPALTFIELQNEDNIFWGAMEATLEQTPTYRKLLCKKFSSWLKQKYKSTENLKNAWDNEGLDEGESIEAKNIYPHPNHHYFSEAYETALKEGEAVPLHIADKATFLYEEQMAFYTKFVKAIRDTGYRGVIVGSCWQAGSGISHFYNLHSDYVAGVIDRHNYFGGGTGHTLKPGKFSNAAMVSQPGSGLLSTGFQQVIDRPFQISEWMSLVPTEWVAESAPLIATYGMGLQGWDASYSFAMDYTHFTNTIQSGHGVYNVTSPTHLTLYPALAAMIYRSDVTEAEVLVNRNINIADLRKGNLAVVEKTIQGYDAKSFESSVPMEALGIGRITISFNDPSLDISKDMKEFWNREEKRLTSTTGELHWNYKEKGYSTINTPGTKGMIGFAPNISHALGNYTIETRNEFAVIFISSLEKEKTLAETNRALITTIARARNTGMVYNEDKTELLKVGESPILMEPVEAVIEIPANKKATVYVLDHSGFRTGEIVPVSNTSLVLDGKKHEAIYYEIEFE